MKKTILYFAVFLVISIGCKTNKKESEPFISQIHLKQNLSNFTSLMNEKDTININCFLQMEWWERIDKIQLTKQNNKIVIKTSIKEDTTYSFKREYRNVELDNRIMSVDNRFENYFYERKNRTTKNDEFRHLMFQIYNQNDTINFYTSNLGDKGFEVDNYYSFMRGIFPYNDNFVFPRIVEDGTDPLAKYKNELILTNKKGIKENDLYKIEKENILFIPVKSNKKKYLINKYNDTLTNDLVKFSDSIAMNYLNNHNIKYKQTEKRFIQFVGDNKELIIIDKNLLKDNETVIIFSSEFQKPYSIQSIDLIDYLYGNN